MSARVASLVVCTLLLAAGRLGGQSASALAATLPCPDATDVAATIEHYVDVSYHAYRADTLQLPQDCLFTGVARQRVVADSSVERMLAMLDAVLSRRNVALEVLDARLRLLFRGGRYDAVGAAFDRLVRIDTAEASQSNYRIVIAAQQRRADTATMRRYLAAAINRFPSDGLLGDEARILETAGKQRALLVEMRRAPARRAEVYPTMISIFGNLNQPDSVVAVIHRAFAQHVPPKDLAPSLHSMVASLIRTAQLQNAPDIWSLTMMSALMIDSTLSTAETQYLVALSVAEDIGNEIAMLPLRQPQVPVDLRPAVCPRIPALLALVARGEDRLDATGTAFGESASRIRAQLKVYHEAWLDPIHEICVARPGG